MIINFGRADNSTMFNNVIVIVYCLIMLLHGITHSESLRLGELKPTLGPIEILEFEPTAEDFYRDYVRMSKPVLVRTKNPSWKYYFQRWKDENFMKNAFGNVHGKVYMRSVWTQGWPMETRMKFSDFLTQTSNLKTLFWDSQLPLNNMLFRNLPMPKFLRCSKFHDWMTDAVLLYTKRNTSSVFHHDGSENFFFQISGKKTWLIANHSIGNAAYANEYDLQPGLSPINPEFVDLEKFPLASNINFYKITTEPGDFLYVPEYWWHHVRSFDPPVVAIGIWSAIFNFPGLENANDIVAYTAKFAELRQLEPKEITCEEQPVSLFDAKKKKTKAIFSSSAKRKSNRQRLYFGSDEGAFYCVDSFDGSVVWKHVIEGDAGSTPIVDEENGVVYFADETGSVYGFSSAFGELRWSTNLQDGVASALKLSSNKKKLYVASLDMHLYAINSFDGNILWKQGPFSGKIWSTPKLIEDNILISIFTEKNDSSVIMVNANFGNIIWKYSTASSPIFATPAVDEINKLAYVIDAEGRIHVLNLVNGSLKHLHESGEKCESSPVLNEKNNRLYFVSVSGAFKCLDTTLFKPIWERQFKLKQEDTVLSSPLLSLESNILYAAVGRALYAMNAESGHIIWDHQANGEFISSPRIDQNKMLYIGCSDNFLLAFDGADGVLKWSLKTGGPVVSSVAMDHYFLHNQTFGALL